MVPEKNAQKPSYVNSSLHKRHHIPITTAVKESRQKKLSMLQPIGNPTPLPTARGSGESQTWRSRTGLTQWLWMRLSSNAGATWWGSSCLTPSSCQGLPHRAPGCFFQQMTSWECHHCEDPPPELLLEDMEQCLFHASSLNNLCQNMVTPSSTKSCHRGSETPGLLQL